MGGVRILVFLVIWVCGLNAQDPVVLDESQLRQLAIERPQPVYPPTAKAAQVSGDVVLQVEIGTDGKVSKTVILSGPSMLKQAAVDAVAKWTFKPYERDGQVVPVTATIAVKFRLAEPVDENDRAIAKEYFPLFQRCSQMVTQRSDVVETAKVCREAADQADRFESGTRFIERRSAYVFSAAALIANKETKPALVYADKAVAVVAQGHDDGSGSSAAYGVRAQAKALTGDLPGADKDLDQAEEFERAALRGLAGRELTGTYTQNLRALLEFHARVLTAMGRKEQATAKRDAAEKL